MGTHPIFESDFDCLTEWINRWRHPRASPSGSLGVRGSETTRPGRSTIDPANTVPRHRGDRTPQRRIKSWRNCLNVQYASTTSYHQLCSAMQVIWSVKIASQNSRIALHAVVKHPQFEIWPWKKSRLQSTFRVNTTQAAAIKVSYTTRRPRTKKHANLDRITVPVRGRAANGREI